MVKIYLLKDEAILESLFSSMAVSTLSFAMNTSALMLCMTGRVVSYDPLSLPMLLPLITRDPSIGMVLAVVVADLRGMEGGLTGISFPSVRILDTIRVIRT